MKQKPPVYIEGVLYDHTMLNGMAIPILTEIPEISLASRFPCFETVLGLSYKIQECSVRITGHNNNICEFLLALSYEPDGPVNQGLFRLCNAVQWRGRILAMKRGRRASVVNMRGHGDRHMCDKAVSR